MRIFLVLVFLANLATLIWIQGDSLGDLAKGASLAIDQELASDQKDEQIGALQMQVAIGRSFRDRAFRSHVQLTAVSVLVCLNLVAILYAVAYIGMVRAAVRSKDVLNRGRLGRSEAQPQR